MILRICSLLTNCCDSAGKYGISGKAEGVLHATYKNASGQLANNPPNRPHKALAIYRDGPGTFSARLGINLHFGCNHSYSSGCVVVCPEDEIRIKKQTKDTPASEQISNIQSNKSNYAPYWDYMKSDNIMTRLINLVEKFKGYPKGGIPMKGGSKQSGNMKNKNGEVIGGDELRLSCIDFIIKDPKTWKEIHCESNTA